MATYTGTTSSATHRRTTAVACGAVLALAAVAGLGVWQVGLHSRGSSRAALLPAAGLQQSALQPSTGAPASAAVVATSTGVARGTQTTMLYLVSTPAEVATTRAGLQSTSAIFAQNGVPPFQVEVMAVTSKEEERDLLTAIAGVDMSPSGPLWPVQVIDLRSTGATAPQADPLTEMRIASDQIAITRAMLGQPPLDDPMP